MLRAVVVACVLAAAFAPRPQAPEKPIVDDNERYSVTALPSELGYDATFYKKYADAAGIPIIASAKVPDKGLLIARDVVIYMLSARPDVRREMIARRFRISRAVPPFLSLGRLSVPISASRCDPHDPVHPSNRSIQLLILTILPLMVAR